MKKRSKIIVGAALIFVSFIMCAAGWLYSKGAHLLYISSMYQNGFILPKDSKKAILWLTKAYGSDNHPAVIVKAKDALGTMYISGIDVPPDYERAAKLFNEVYGCGMQQQTGLLCLDAQYKRGQQYEEGSGVRRNYKKAIEWYTKAATHGHAWSQYRLGVMHQQGKGVPRDDKQAAMWYIKAAKNGCVPAQSNLGMMYEQGAGVPRDDVQAGKWLLLALVSNSLPEGMQKQSSIKYDMLTKRIGEKKTEKIRELAEKQEGEYGGYSIWTASPDARMATLLSFGRLEYPWFADDGYKARATGVFLAAFNMCSDYPAQECSLFSECLVNEMMKSPTQKTLSPATEDDETEQQEIASKCKDKYLKN